VPEAKWLEKLNQGVVHLSEAAQARPDVATGDLEYFPRGGTAMKRLTPLVVIAICAVMIAIAGPQASHTTRVLFIGNSYTYFNNLPEIFAKLAEAGHKGRVEVSTVAPGGWRLKDHWEKGTALQLLDAEKWDFVVLQDQSTLGIAYWVEGKDHVNSDAIFRPYAEKWAAAVHARGAMPVFFLTWAGKNAPEDQAALNYAYARAAKDTGSFISPVGIAWETLRREKPNIGLFYEGHGSHPSPAGSYLAACVLYATIFHQSPLGLPPKIIGTPVNLKTEKPETNKSTTLADLNAKDAETLQAEAWNTWQRIANNGGYPEISPPQTPSLQPLPAGLPLSEPDLDGTWEGTILFYPIGPVDMVLRVRNTQSAKAQLEIKYHSKDLPDESIELSDFRVQDSSLSFSVPKSVGVDNLAVHFVGVMPRRGELQGTAEARRENVEVLGSWTLKKVTSGSGLAPY
jgi:hypothetical protein